MTRHDSNELFKIFFALLTLQLLFCKKLVGREKIYNIQTSLEYTSDATIGQKGTLLPSSWAMASANAVFPVPEEKGINITRLELLKTNIFPYIA